MRPTGSAAALSFLLALVTMATGCVDTDRWTGLDLAKDLQSYGVPAEAEILSIADTMNMLNDDPIIRLEVLVRPADRAPFRATIQRLVITNLQIPQYQPGKAIAVRFDPRDPSRVSIDLGPPPVAGRP
jgi:hypothetical protein